jgi:hypothetical protein
VSHVGDGQSALKGGDLDAPALSGVTSIVSRAL